jgi:hypothetical protein
LSLSLNAPAVLELLANLPHHQEGELQKYGEAHEGLLELMISGLAVA